MKDVAAAGGRKDMSTLVDCYQQPDNDTLWVVDFVKPLGGVVPVNLPGNGHLSSTVPASPAPKCPVLPGETVAETVAMARVRLALAACAIPVRGGPHRARSDGPQRS